MKYLLIILLFVLDLLNIFLSRELLREFLRGEVGGKKARKIHATQTKINKFHMQYVNPYIKKYHKQFAIYNRLYQFELLSLGPMYGLLLAFWLTYQRAAIIYLIVCVLLKGVVCVIQSIPFNTEHRTKFSL